jgi:hypothetical protein
MPEQYASAWPRKRFFSEMFTRDISLQDCILDLIDNSIDGAIRSRKIRFDQLSKAILNKERTQGLKDPPSIEVAISKDKVVVRDSCGGIDRQYAMTEVFSFGHSDSWRPSYLGAYGVGLKRALFKIGNRFRIVSRTASTGFSCNVDVPEWLLEEDSPEDWRIPLDDEPQAQSPSLAGTTIEITKLHDEVKLSISDSTFEMTLRRSISGAYSFFLQNYVVISVNGIPIEGISIPIGKPERGAVSHEVYTEKDVTVRVLASVAQPDEEGRLSQEISGWYVVCNGRIVLPADKSTSTGWGISPTPSYQPKYRGFIGIIFFEAKDPLLLPWTTTKRELNREAPIYVSARTRMAIAAKPVLGFLNRKYGAGPDEEPYEREVSRSVQPATLRELTRAKSTFAPPERSRLRAKETTSVQFDAQTDELNLIRTHLRNPRMGANRIGAYVMAYFLEKEGLK